MIPRHGLRQQRVVGTSQEIVYARRGTLVALLLTSYEQTSQMRDSALYLGNTTIDRDQDRGQIYCGGLRGVP